MVAPSLGFGGFLVGSMCEWRVQWHCKCKCMMGFDFMTFDSRAGMSVNKLGKVWRVNNGEYSLEPDWSRPAAGVLG